MAVSAFAVIWTIQRLFDLHWPLAWIAVTLGAVTLITSTVWTLATREDALTAGARLDQAAGLRERVSTSQYCTQGQDDFADAVVADAEKAVRGIQVRRLIRLTPPPQWGWAVAASLFAVAPFLIPPGLLKPAQAKAGQDEVVVKTTVKDSGKPPIAIDYRMARSADGWKVLDVVVEDLSLVTNYRGTFASEISRSGIDGLIKVLDEKNRTLAKS